MKFYELVPFVLTLNPSAVADAAKTLRPQSGRGEEEE
jgi:hypothetical protein